jgi:hypothetical protein
MRVTGLDVHISVRMVREADAELVVDLAFELRAGAAEQGDYVLEPGDERAHLGRGQRAVGGLAAELALEGAALVVDLGDPLADDRRVGTALNALPLIESWTGYSLVTCGC